MTEVFFLVRGELSGEAGKTSREAARKKQTGLSPTSTTRSDERFLPLASEKTSGIQGTEEQVRTEKRQNTCILPSKSARHCLVSNREGLGTSL